MNETTSDILQHHVGTSRAGAALLIASSAVLLVVNTWHSIQGGADLSGKALAELMVMSGRWAEMHLVGSFAFAALAVAACILVSAPGAFGSGPITRTGLAVVFVGSLLSSVGFVIDGQRAFIAPAVLRGEDLPIFVALTYLWDDRGLGVVAFVVLGLGAAVLAAGQLGRVTVSPTWATVLGIVGGLAAVVFFASAFGLRIFLPKVLGFPSFFAFAWLILAGALALRGSRAPRAVRDTAAARESR